MTVMSIHSYQVRGQEQLYKVIALERKGCGGTSDKLLDNRIRISRANDCMVFCGVVAQKIGYTETRVIKGVGSLE